MTERVIVKRQIAMYEEDWERLKEIGDGNVPVVHRVALCPLAFHHGVDKLEELSGEGGE